jgi:hypothetical protein
MLDRFAIVSTTLCFLYILWRAAFFDRTLPWMEGPETSRDDIEDRDATGRDHRRF